MRFALYVTETNLGKWYGLFLKANFLSLVVLKKTRHVQNITRTLRHYPEINVHKV